jgi:hypothetical protein
MSSWKEKALDLFPDLKPDLDEEDATTYTLFFELLPRCLDAHKRGDNAEWCFSQPEEALWNAAGVAFYGHLVDAPLSREQIPIWLSPEVFSGVHGLFEWRMEPAEFELLKARYSSLHPD